VARFIRRGGSRTGPQRRSGPVGEQPWWDPTDQAFAERPVLDRRTLGSRWLDVPMLNNEERRLPYGSDEASEAVEQARRARTPTGLDEGRAWRHRDSKTLVVARVEVFAEAGDDHRAAWQRLGAASLNATWRERWRERDVTPGWIESVAVVTGERPGALHAFSDAPATGLAGAVDWFRVEDHTDPSGAGDVRIYQHLSIWSDRAVAVLVARHDVGRVVDDELAKVAAVAFGRLDPTLPG
jgi:hypothetical protein